MSGKYTLILADPPWQYRDKCSSGERGVHFKYPVMNINDICRLPVHSLAAESCLLAMWWVPTMPAEALKVIDAWGFRLMTMKGFTWGKTYKKQTDKLAIGMGHMTRANSEDMLFAVKGKLPPRMSAKVRQLQIYPRTDHSAKPPEFRDHLVELLGDVPRIELFARQSAEGWDHWGNELKSETALIPGGFVKGAWVKKPDNLKVDRQPLERLISDITQGSKPMTAQPELQSKEPPKVAGNPPESTEKPPEVAEKPPQTVEKPPELTGINVGTIGPIDKSPNLDWGESAKPQTAKEEVELEVEADPQARFNPHQLLDQFLSGKLKAEHFPTFIAALVIMFGEQDTYHIKQIQVALVAEAEDPGVTITGLTDYQRELMRAAGRSLRSYGIVSPNLQVQAVAAMVQGGALKENSIKTILNGIDAKFSQHLPQAATHET